MRVHSAPPSRNGDAEGRPLPPPHRAVNGRSMQVLSGPLPCPQAPVQSAKGLSENPPKQTQWVPGRVSLPTRDGSPITAWSNSLFQPRRHTRLVWEVGSCARGRRRLSGGTLQPSRARGCRRMVQGQGEGGGLTSPC